MEHERTDEYLTISQAAKYLSISEPVLRLTIRCGKLPVRGRARNGRPLLRKGDLRRFIDPLSEVSREAGRRDLSAGEPD